MKDITTWAWICGTVNGKQLICKQVHSVLFTFSSQIASLLSGVSKCASTFCSQLSFLSELILCSFSMLFSVFWLPLAFSPSPWYLLLCVLILSVFTAILSSSSYHQSLFTVNYDLKLSEPFKQKSSRFLHLLLFISSFQVQYPHIFPNAVIYAMNSK